MNTDAIRNLTYALDASESHELTVHILEDIRIWAGRQMTHEVTRHDRRAEMRQLRSEREDSTSTDRI